MLYGEENHEYKNATPVAPHHTLRGRKSKAGGEKSKATQLYTPLIILSDIGGEGAFSLGNRQIFAQIETDISFRFLYLNKN